MPTFLQNNQSIAIDDELRTTSCWCGIHLAIPRNLYKWARESEHNAVYCPLGHEFVFNNSNAEKLKAAEARERHLEDQLRAAENEAEATRRRLIRERHRFANGVCPCCDRSFTNVARHMETQHPDYDSSHLSAASYSCSCGREFASPHGLRMHQVKTSWGTHRTVVA